MSAFPYSRSVESKLNTMTIQTIVTQAVEKQIITAQELKEIRKMLEQLEFSKDDLYAVGDLTEAMLSGSISRV